MMNSITADTVVSILKDFTHKARNIEQKRICDEFMAKKTWKSSKDLTLNRDQFSTPVDVYRNGCFSLYLPTGGSPQGIMPGRF